MQDCNNSIVNGLELLQCGTNPVISTDCVYQLSYIFYNIWAKHNEISASIYIYIYIYMFDWNSNIVMLITHQ